MPRNVRLSKDATELLALLPAEGVMTNQTAIMKTGWDRDRLTQAKYELRECGLVEIAPSFGNSFGRINGRSKDDRANGLPSLKEKELYGPFEEWIRNSFEPDQPTLFDHGIFSVVKSADRRQRPRKWEVPDLLALSCRRYSYVPSVQLDLMSYELKRKADAFHPYGIFEAISQSKLVHYAFYCFEWEVQKDFLDDPAFQRIRQEAQLHGIGLVHMYWIDRKQRRMNAEIILEPRRREPEASILNEMIAVYFPPEVKAALRRYVADHGTTG